MKKWLMLCLLAGSISLIGDDVQQVNNGKSPKGSAYTLKLTEDLRIGMDDGEDEYLWPGLSVTVEANNKGHMFVMDPLGKRILEFDENGKFLQEIGGRGEGPGEFNFISQFQVFPDGSSVAFGRSGSQTTCSFFDGDGKFVTASTSTSPAFILQQINFSPDKKRVAASALILDFTKPNMTTVFSVLNDKFEPQEEIFKYETPSVNPQRFGESAYWTEFLADQFRPYAHGKTAFFSFDKDGNLYTAIAKKYEITKWDSKGNKMMVFGREYTPIPQSEEEIQAVVDPILEILTAQLPPQLQAIVTQKVIEKAVENAEFPARKSPIGNLLTMEDGTLIVIHDTNSLTRESTGDLFSREGKFLGSFTHGKNGMARFIFKNGFAYTMETNEEDDNELVRYKVAIVKK